MTVQKLLRYRFAAMFAWFVLVVAALAVINAMTARVDNPVGRVAAGAGVVAALLFGLLAQRRCCGALPLTRPRG